MISTSQSVDSHEKGATHIANVERELSKTRKNKQDLEIAERLFNAEMQRIEAEAMKKFEEDAKRDSFAKDEMERVLQAKAKSMTGPTYR